MDNDQQTCDLERITLSLGQELSDEEQAAFELHLEACDDCRRRFEKAAASDDMWSDVRDSLLGQQADCPQSSVSAFDSELDPGPPSTAGGDASFGCDTVLELLAPTDDDRMLGRLGMYEVVGIVGSGGMGVVLKAFDAALDRYVAIKVLTPHLGNSGSARKRFSREARAAAAVVHDNVIEIHGVADAGGLPYLVMPYVRGPSLQRRLDDDGPLALAEILRIGVQAAKGLAAAHAQGLVHRDVKPANILLEEGVERVKLTDFGLARAADDASLTRTGVIAGTPQYMSPEQARGESVDQRSDLFSLGSVLYAMCTGRAPFRAETSYGVLRRITDEEPRPIPELNPDIPEWLCRIIARLMSKQPDDRHESAAEVADLLEECLAHVQQPTAVPLPDSLATQTAGSRFFSPSRRSIGVFAMSAALGMSLLGMVLWSAAEAPAHFLPDVGTPDVAVVLDLASGKMLPEADASELARLGKGDLAYDDSFGGMVTCLRGGEAAIWIGDRFVEFKPVFDLADHKGYKLPQLPSRLLVKTAENKVFDVTILSAGKSKRRDKGIPEKTPGIRLTYEWADPEIVPTATVVPMPGAPAARQGADAANENRLTADDIAAEREVRTVVESFLAAVVAGRDREASQMTTDPARDVHQLEDLRSVIDSALKVDHVLARNKAAIAVTTEVKADRGREGVLLFQLTKSRGQWLVDDIDLEDEEGLRDEIRRFKIETSNEDQTTHMEGRATTAQGFAGMAPGVGVSPAAFGQVRERVMPFGAPCVMKYFQFHTGDVFEIGDGPGDTSSHAEERKHAELTGGLDFHAFGWKEHIQLVGEGCIFISNYHPNFDTLTAQQTLDQLRRATWLTGVLEIDTKKLPITYLFKTARNECGIMQILAVTDDERGFQEVGMKFRYKLVESTLKESEIERQARLGVVREVPYTKVTLPDVDRRDVNTILDLSSGEFQKNLMREGSAESFATFNRLGKGDLWYDSVLGTMRGATIQKWDGEKRTDVEPGDEQYGARNYPTLVPPVRLLVTTAEGNVFDVKLLGKTGDGGLEIAYRPTDASPKVEEVPGAGDSMMSPGGIGGGMPGGMGGPMPGGMGGDVDPVAAAKAAGTDASTVSITGRVTNIVGGPATGYRVTAQPRVGSSQTAWQPTVMTDEDGNFTFRGLPDGPCNVSATPTPLTNQPNIEIMDIVLKKGEPVHVELSLERKYHYAGRVTDAEGKPQSDCFVMAIWEDPEGKHTYISDTRTDSFGRYTFSTPFPMAKTIEIQGMQGPRVPAQHDVKHGRDDIDFKPTVEGDKPTAQEIEVPGTVNLNASILPTPKARFLPDVGTPFSGEKPALVLASGKMVEGDPSGDLFYESGCLFFMRGAMPLVWNGHCFIVPRAFSHSPSGTLRPSCELPSLPCQLYVKTVDGWIFEIMIRADVSREADGGIPREIPGVSVTYKLADPKIASATIVSEVDLPPVE